jgi:hypothetical protein
MNQMARGRRINVAMITGTVIEVIFFFSSEESFRLLLVAIAPVLVSTGGVYADNISGFQYDFQVQVEAVGSLMSR